MIERKNIDVELTPQEIKQRTRAFGDFSNMNKQYIQSRSEINHRRI